MIDIKLLAKGTQEPGSYFQLYKKQMKSRGMNSEILHAVLELYKKQNQAITQMEQQKALQNKVSRDIAIKKGKKENCQDQIQEMQELGRKVKEQKEQVEEIKQELQKQLLELPNKVHSTVPLGSSEEQNVLVRKWGEVKAFSFSPKEHWDLAEDLEIVNFVRAAKVTGSRFTFLQGAGAQMERALLQFMMDFHGQKGKYREMLPPYLVHTRSMVGTGQFPKFKEDVFHIQGYPYHLIPTAEVPITNYYADEILKEQDLPQRFVAFSPCFRSEAGSHGKDTRGIFRQHQFHKVELMTFCHPDTSYEEHETLTRDAEKTLQALNLPYQVVNKCTTDLTFGAAKCYDLEVWLPGIQCYREISSCSNFEDFQARRAHIRFRDGNRKIYFVHTLNGSGLAIGRTLIAILENYQNEDGSVTVPEVLQPYMRNKKILHKKK